MDVESVKNIWQSERLTFRAIAPDDQEWMFNEVQSDPLNMCLGTPVILAPPSRKKPEDWIQMWQGKDSLMNVVICLRQSSATLTEERADDRKAAAAPISTTERIGFLALGYGGGYGRSPHSRACNLGILLTAPYRSKGYGTEAVNWAVDWAFRHGNMHSVNLSSIEYNTQAHRCYEKCGFKPEGRRRQCWWHDRKWYDLLLFGILEDEWEELRKTRSEAGPV